MRELGVDGHTQDLGVQRSELVVAVGEGGDLGGANKAAKETGNDARGIQDIEGGGWRPAGCS